MTIPRTTPLQEVVADNANVADLDDLLHEVEEDADDNDE